MKQVCIPWEPIPEAANHYTALRVMRFTYTMHRDPLSLIVLSPWKAPDEEKERDIAWRLTFKPTRGFRIKPLGYWIGGTKPPWPEKGNMQAIRPNGPAMWEVTSSLFLNECLQSEERRRGWHLFVIADFDESYEIVAREWTSERLPGPWQEHIYGTGSSE